MLLFFKLSILAIFSSAILLSIYFTGRSKYLNTVSSFGKQWIIFILLAMFSVLCIKLRIAINESYLYLFDTTILFAGMVFGIPMGIGISIISATVGYIFGVGFGQFLGSIFTLLFFLFLGFSGGMIRKFVCDDVMPKWYYGFVAAIVVIISKLGFTFITHTHNFRETFLKVDAIILPATFLTTSICAITLFVISYVEKENIIEDCTLKGIKEIFERWLLVIMVTLFIILSLAIWVFQTETSMENTKSLLFDTVSDVQEDLIQSSDRKLLTLNHIIVGILSNTDDIRTANLRELAKKYGLVEICIVNDKGFVTHSTEESDIGFNMASGKQSAEFLVLLNGEVNHLVQRKQAKSSEANVSRKYSGVVLPHGGFVQVAFNIEKRQQAFSSNVMNILNNRYRDDTKVIIANNKNVIVSDDMGYKGKTLEQIGLKLYKHFEGELFTAKINEESYFCMYLKLNNYSIISIVSTERVYYVRKVTLYMAIIMRGLFFIAIFIGVYCLLKRLVINNVNKINDSLDQITQGNLDIIVNVRANREFASISDGINATVNTLKKYIDDEKARFDKELEFAKTIQHSVLPSIFPPYPHRQEFDLFASMFTAKEVGGDFYDFYFVDEDRLAFLIADVSGKGVPAAMFMMRAKTVIRGFAEAGHDVHTVFTLANNVLCENNDATMFVTAWLGILDLKTGIIEFCNAGHNPPLVRRKDGEFEYLVSDNDLILAAMDDIEYHKHSIKIEIGDEIFLYTDGATEAINEDTVIYGENRLLQVLNQNKNKDVEVICSEVVNNIDSFAGNAPQFDDITMLLLRLKTLAQ